jgi:hypothetical protein
MSEKRKMHPDVRERWMKSRVKHGGYMGGSEKAEHYIWRSMLQRCQNPKNNQWRYYGGKGISVCEEWLSYSNFISDMGGRPSKDHSLERINNDEGYNPNNCRWATRSEQQKNKTTTKFYTNGSFLGTLVDCAKHIGISKELAHWRWKSWGTFEKGVRWQAVQKNV